MYLIWYKILYWAAKKIMTRKRASLFPFHLRETEEWRLQAGRASFTLNVWNVMESGTRR